MRPLSFVSLGGAFLDAIKMGFDHDNGHVDYVDNLNFIDTNIIETNIGRLPITVNFGNSDLRLAFT